MNSNAAHNQIAHVQGVDELRGKSIFEMFPPDLAAQFYTNDQMVLKTGQALLNVERTTWDGQGQLRTMLTTLMCYLRFTVITKLDSICLMSRR